MNPFTECWQTCKIHPANNKVPNLRILFSLKEPILKDYQGDKEIYRFTWLRTRYHPVSIRFEKQDETIKVFTKVCNGAGGG